MACGSGATCPTAFHTGLNASPFGTRSTYCRCAAARSTYAKRRSRDNLSDGRRRTFGDGRSLSMPARMGRIRASCVHATRETLLFLGSPYASRTYA